MALVGAVEERETGERATCKRRECVCQLTCMCRGDGRATSRPEKKRRGDTVLAPSSVHRGASEGCGFEGSRGCDLGEAAHTHATVEIAHPCR